jgi:hypothetical protein
VDGPRLMQSATKQTLTLLLVTALSLLAVGLMATVLSIAVDWAMVRAVWGNQFAGHAALHIRFGPNATATKEKPAANQPHP